MYLSPAGGSGMCQVVSLTQKALLPLWQGTIEAVRKCGCPFNCDDYHQESPTYHKFILDFFFFQKGSYEFNPVLCWTFLGNHTFWHFNDATQVFISILENIYTGTGFKEIRAATKDDFVGDKSID